MSLNNCPFFIFDRLNVLIFSFYPSKKSTLVVNLLNNQFIYDEFTNLITINIIKKAVNNRHQIYVKNSKVEKKKTMESREECTNNKSSRYKSLSQSFHNSTHQNVELIAEFSWTSSTQIFSHLDLFNQLGVHQAFNCAFEHLQKILFFKIDWFVNPQELINTTRSIDHAICYLLKNPNL